MSLEPMGERVLVKILSKEETTKSGIVLAATAELDPTERAEVISIGGGKRGYDGKFIPINLAVGDIVVYVKNTGIEINSEGEKLLLIQEEAVLAKVTEEQ